MISKQQYEHWKPLIVAYEKRQRGLNKVKGKSECPFCGGSKITPFVPTSKSQHCNMCDKDGNISNRKLADLELLDFIKK